MDVSLGLMKNASAGNENEVAAFKLHRMALNAFCDAFQRKQTIYSTVLPALKAAKRTKKDKKDFYLDGVLQKCRKLQLCSKILY
jgi:hypothetical protein